MIYPGLQIPLLVGYGVAYSPFLLSLLPPPRSKIILPPLSPHRPEFENLNFIIFGASLNDDRVRLQRLKTTRDLGLFSTKNRVLKKL